MSTDDVFEGSERNRVYVWLNLVMSIIGSVASLTTLVLIRRMKSSTGHVYLVFIMSVYQLMYDMTLFFSNVNCGYYVTAVCNFFQLLGGVSGSLVSNWMAFIALYIVWYRQRFDIFENMKIIQFSCFLPGFIPAVMYFIATVPESHYSSKLEYISVIDIYYTLRLASIVLNFAIVFLIAMRIYCRTSRSSLAGGYQTEQEIAIRTLCRRMIFYPVVQAIGRSGYSWYELEYGTNLDADDDNNTKYASMIFLTIITPTVSVGYLIIFLLMQPNAYRQLKSMLGCGSSAEEPRSQSTVSKFPSMRANSHATTAVGSDSQRHTQHSSFEAQGSHMYDGGEMSEDPFNVDRFTTVSTGTVLGDGKPGGLGRVSMIEWMRKSSVVTTLESMHMMMHQPQVRGDGRDEEELYRHLQGRAAAPVPRMSEMIVVTENALHRPSQPIQQTIQQRPTEGELDSEAAAGTSRDVEEVAESHQ